MPDNIYAGNQRLRLGGERIRGSLVYFEGDQYYLIDNYDLMAPFLMAIVSNSDHWMYISCSGGLTAGRRNPDNAIFPYYTDDKIHESYTTTGSKTIVLAGSGDKKRLWEPFSDRYRGIYKIKRRLYKHVTGNRVIFEEENEALHLIYRYSWMNSDRYGWIKKNWLVNNAGQEVRLSVLDGVRNILPYGVNQMMQTGMSTLVDAYKKNELDPATGLGIYRLSSIPVDRAVPSEALKCTSVWSAGYNTSTVLLSNRQLEDFIHGGNIATETGTRALKGCYFTVADLILKPEEEVNNYYVLETEQDAPGVEELISMLSNDDKLPALLEEDVARGTARLIDLVGMADGIEITDDRVMGIRHFSNVLFNCMRGGLFEDDYNIRKEYFGRHLGRFNSGMAIKYRDWLEKLPGIMALDELMEKVKERDDADLLRLALEYLPLSFSRRHGDPSRPWNRFDIRLKEDDGSLSQSYQGNWRDIFQNWEALALSYPGFLPSMISRFLNSSTVDGYNPYRISSEGIDWEVPEKDNPWSHIGYWGDHQVIYLLRLLELNQKFMPQQLDEWLDRQIFSYANVPYRIKDIEDIIRDPYETIVFEEGKNREIEKLSVEKGADGRMVYDKHGKIVKASFTEKILLTVLTRLVNMIPGAGIWMNTQRPEWNDANNALVGNGASMVTLYYMRRMTAFLINLYGSAGNNIFSLREELFFLFETVNNILLENRDQKGNVDNKLRRIISERLGKAGSDYRNSVYKGFSGRFTRLNRKHLLDFFGLVQEYIDTDISVNRRPDGLYNAYNLVSIEEESIDVLPLQEMLEGQVALLSSGMPSPDEAAGLIEIMYGSDLYRADQDSFMLYPDAELRSFRDMNIISDKDVEASLLLQKLLRDGNTLVIKKDIKGKYHFNGSFTSAEDLKKALDSLPAVYKKLAGKEKELIAGIFESVFNHKMFTGRSGSFFKYEGLGSIYWHMVSKLLLAAGEYVVRAEEEGCDKKIIDRLAGLYYRLRAGIGADKSPSEYGAFPVDPYSHTPSMMGAQQPGMTGQVKEDIISRNIELGIRIEGGCLSFKPLLLRRKEFVNDEYGRGSLRFTCCNTPVRYLTGTDESMQLLLPDGEKLDYKEPVLDKRMSRAVFMRTGLIERIDVILPETRLLAL
ncbi:MAG: hypothetical protein ACLFN1_08025 [Bacteroidales bacterium]